MSRRNKNRTVPEGKPQNWVTGPVSTRDDFPGWTRVHVTCLGAGGGHADRPRRFGWLSVDSDGNAVGWHLRPSRRLIATDEDMTTGRSIIVFRCRCGIDEPFDGADLTTIAGLLSAANLDTLDVAHAATYRHLLTSAANSTGSESEAARD